MALGKLSLHLGFVGSPYSVVLTATTEKQPWLKRIKTSIVSASALRHGLCGNVHIK